MIFHYVTYGFLENTCHSRQKQVFLKKERMHFNLETTKMTPTFQ